MAAWQHARDAVRTLALAGAIVALSLGCSSTSTNEGSGGAAGASGGTGGGAGSSACVPSCINAYPGAPINTYSSALKGCTCGDAGPECVSACAMTCGKSIITKECAVCAANAAGLVGQCMGVECGNGDCEALRACILKCP